MTEPVNIFNITFFSEVPTVVEKGLNSFNSNRVVCVCVCVCVWPSRGVSICYYHNVSLHEISPNSVQFMVFLQER